MQLNQKLDAWLTSRFQGVAQDPALRASIEAVKQKAATGQASSGDVLNLAWRESAASFAKQGQVVGSEAIRGRAIAIANVAGMESPFLMSDLPQGHDKTHHFLVSAWLSQKLTASADRWLPRFAAEWVGLGVTKTVGVLKEFVDLFTGGSSSREDIVADFKGARSGVALGRAPQ